MRTSLHNGIEIRFFLRRLDERNTPLSLGEEKDLRFLYGRSEERYCAVRRGCSGTKLT
jgi:hypothetical protein